MAAPARARNVESRPRPAQMVLGFNVAAPARARNVAGFIPDFLRRPCFNVAAPAQAQNAVVSVRHNLRRIRFNVAAPAQARNAAGTCHCIPWLAQASTWPRPRGRGITAGTCHCIPWLAQASTWPRPRRRGMNGAKLSTGHNLPNGFNVAAPARARNGKLGCRLSAGRKWLQRGRARAGAEWAAHVDVNTGRILASTWPRPRGRGMNTL